MSRRKNVLIFYTDQQRADSLACMGNPNARTANLDALAERGVLYTNHYATNPVCMPSRACFHTGRYPQANRVLDNGIFLPEDQPTLAETFRRAGYRTASFGKLHFQTFCPHEDDESMESLGRWRRGELDDWDGPYYGFETVGLTLGHGEGAHGHYGRWRERQFGDDRLGADNAQGEDVFRQFGCWRSNLPLEYHHSTWVADRAIEFLDGAGDEPFLLHVGFPDPHHPFTPPAPYHSMFDDVEFPPPHAVEGENASKPLPWREAMTGRPFPTDGGARYEPELAGRAYQRVIASTHGMVALIDDSVGRVLAKLDQLGLTDDTVIVFTSDHGDFQGDHFLLHKGQIPCRSLLNIPLIVADPDRPSGVCDGVCSNVDVMPALLTACGLDVPETVQGVVLPNPGEAPVRPYAFEAGWSKASEKWQHYSIYTQDWRMSCFPWLADGELYDLQADPHEHRNLFHEPTCRGRRDEMTELLLEAVGRAEPARPPVVADW